MLRINPMRLLSRQHPEDNKAYICSIADDILNQIRGAANTRILFLSHAMSQMMRSERMITTGEVRSVIEDGEVIEGYPEDPRGHSCLQLGRGEGSRPIHVVCSPKQDYLAIITAYPPDPAIWFDDFKHRRAK